MTNKDAVAAEDLRITVEMGDEFTPSAELQTALDDLRSVLETESSETVGFMFEVISAHVVAPTRSFSFSTDFSKVEYGYTENDSKGKK